MNEKPVRTKIDFNKALNRITQYPKELLSQHIYQKKDDLGTPEVKQRAPTTSKKTMKNNDQHLQYFSIIFGK